VRILKHVHYIAALLVGMRGFKCAFCLSTRVQVSSRSCKEDQRDLSLHSGGLCFLNDWTRSDCSVQTLINVNPPHCRGLIRGGAGPLPSHGRCPYPIGRRGLSTLTTEAVYRRISGIRGEHIETCLGSTITLVCSIGKAARLAALWSSNRKTR